MFRLVRRGPAPAGHRYRRPGTDGEEVTGMATSTSLPSGEPVIRTVAMPADTNPAGDIFGGWLMAQMDQIGRAHV